MPRELLRAPGHDRGRSLGWLAAAWIEHFCVHGPGDVQGEAVVLDDELLGFVADCYALEPSGRRQYDDAFLSRAKGRAKSELAGFLVLFEGFGPCRFAGWAKGGETYDFGGFVYTYSPGEPMGQHVTYPFIRCMATEESQSGNTYDNVYYNLTEGPLASHMPRDAAGLTRVMIPGGGEIRPSTAANASKDGGKETYVVFDEVHQYVLPELRRMYATVSRNKSKRKIAQPWALLTSTMYRPGENSVAEKSHERAQAIRDGRVREHRLLFDHREAPAGVDLTNRAAIISALREVYGPAADWMDLDGMIDREFWNIERDIEDTRRYFFNQPTGSHDSWLAAPDLKQNASDAVISEGDDIALFFDGSVSDDATGLVGVRISDGLAFVAGCWERPEGHAGDGWRVDKADVDRRVREVHRQFKVAAFFADVKEFEQYIDSWGSDFGGGYVIEATGGKARHAVAWDMRGHLFDFTVAAGRHLVDIKEADAPYEDPDSPAAGPYASALVRHTLNARRSSNKYGVSITKEGRESPKKIDLAVCWIGARMVRRLVLASPKWSQRRTRTGRVAGF